MGVRASMSISLLRDGRLWGLIACHHYAGPHTPPYGVRAAAEFLGSTLSLRLVDRYEDDDLRRAARGAGGAEPAHRRRPRRVELGASRRCSGHPTCSTSSRPTACVVRHRQASPLASGTVPQPQVADAIAHLGARRGTTTSQPPSALSRDLPGLAVDPAVASGALVITLPDGQYIAWFRREVEQAVDWGGDPHNKAIAVREGDDVRLSPRKSFERWREVVQRPLAAVDGVPGATSAADLRRHLVESLYARARTEVRLAETLQRSLLPESSRRLTRWSAVGPLRARGRRADRR